MSAEPDVPYSMEQLRARLEPTRKLKAAWGATRFVTWKAFVEYHNPQSTNYSPEVIAAVDRIFEHTDINAAIEKRCAAHLKGDEVEVARLAHELDCLSIQLNDKVGPISGDLHTTWEVKR